VLAEYPVTGIDEPAIEQIDRTRFVGRLGAKGEQDRQENGCHGGDTHAEFPKKGEAVRCFYPP
jgi:hypothetical protein